MAWDSTLPQDTVKVRNLSLQIRPNFAALQTADSTCRLNANNLQNRTTPGVAPVDPVTLGTNGYVLYSKEGTAGKPELYGIDADSNVIEYSSQGKIGSLTMGFKMVNLTMAPYTPVLTANHFVLAYGSFSSGGGTIVAKNCTISGSAGTYTVTLSPGFTNTLYVPTATCLTSGALGVAANCEIVSSSVFIIRTYRMDIGTLFAASCSFTVSGGQV
jgi:hypothetical protein